MMKLYALDLVIVLAGVILAALALDGALHLYRRARLRRRGGGAVGVVIDRNANVLGRYLDPFAHPWRGARLHGPESPWSPAARWGESALAWEGFGETDEEAYTHANRLRRRHLQLFGLLRPGEDDGLAGDQIFESPPYL